MRSVRRMLPIIFLHIVFFLVTRIFTVLEGYAICYEAVIFRNDYPWTLSDRSTLYRAYPLN